MSSKYYRTGTIAAPRDDPGFLSGVSIDRLISAAGAQPAAVESVVISMLPSVGEFRLSAVNHDFDDPDTDAFPFELQAPPVFAVDPSRNDGSFYVAVPIRTVAPTDPGGTSGDYRILTANTSVRVTLQLRTTLVAARATATPADDVAVGQTVDFAGSVDSPDPSDAPSWTWDFRDGTTATGSTVSHAFQAPGDYEVYADVSASDGSASQRITVVVSVTGSTPTPTASNPGPGQGTGGSNAPAAGPVTGSGGRVGGAVTGSGSGRPGPTRDPRSVPGANTGSGTAAAPNGSVVGYLLSDADLVAQAPRAAVTPRNDSAPAARAGVEATSLPGWLLGAGAVVVLVALGALSERRRPATTPRTRPRRKR